MRAISKKLGRTTMYSALAIDELFDRTKARHPEETILRALEFAASRNIDPFDALVLLEPPPCFAEIAGAVQRLAEKKDECLRALQDAL